MFPDDVLYTEDHEWLRSDAREFVVGITAYAAEQLGDITYVEFAEPGTEVTRGEAVATVESVKATSDVYAPVSGHIAEVNKRLETHPELVNKDPYGEGWFFKLEGVKSAELKKLMDAKAYAAYVEGLKK